MNSSELLVFYEDIIEDSIEFKIVELLEKGYDANYILEELLKNLDGDLID